MKSKQRTRSVIFCLAATIVLCGTSVFAAPRTTRRTSPAQAAARSTNGRSRARATTDRSAVRRSTSLQKTPVRTVQQTPARRSTVAGNPSYSRNRATSTPRSSQRSSHGNKPQRRSHGNNRIAHRGHGNHHPLLPPPRRDSRPRNTYFGFNLSIVHAAPPLVTVVDPVYAQQLPVSPPIIVAPPPAVQVPTVQPALPLTQGVLFEAIVSREEDIAPKEIMTVDGIVLKIKDTDGYPLDVDIELSVLGHREKFEDLPIGSRVEVYGPSGQLYHVDILAIDDDTETLQFAISQ